MFSTSITNWFCSCKRKSLPFFLFSISWRASPTRMHIIKYEKMYFVFQLFNCTPELRESTFERHLFFFNQVKLQEKTTWSHWSKWFNNIHCQPRSMNEGLILHLRVITIQKKSKHHTTLRPPSRDSQKTCTLRKNSWNEHTNVAFFSISKAKQVQEILLGQLPLCYYVPEHQDATYLNINPFKERHFPWTVAFLKAIAAAETQLARTGRFACGMRWRFS